MVSDTVSFKNTILFSEKTYILYSIFQPQASGKAFLPEESQWCEASVLIESNIPQGEHMFAKPELQEKRLPFREIHDVSHKNHRKPKKRVTKSYKAILNSLWGLRGLRRHIEI